MIKPLPVMLRALWAPKVIKVMAGSAATIAAYDGVSNQLGLPKISAVAGMSGTLLPWWGWLLVAQAIFVYALFEYVRRRDQRNGEELVDITLIRGIEERIGGEIDGVKMTVQDCNETWDVRTATLEIKINDLDTKLSELVALERRIDEAEVTITQLKANIGRLLATSSLTADNIAEQLRGIRDCLSAIFHREKLGQLSVPIQACADALSSTVSAGKQLDAAAWANWLSDEADWWSNVSTWCHWAAPYISDPFGEINKPDPKLYDAEWEIRDAQFPNAAAVHKYKSFRIAAIKFGRLQKFVMQTLDRVAFEPGAGV